jgi:tRNA-guanine family transglycosylase
LLRGGHSQGVRFLAIHNLHHTQRLMARMREAILSDTWPELYAGLRERLTLRIKEPLSGT